MNGVDHPIVISMVGAGNDSHEGEIPEHLEEMGEVENIARQVAGFKTTLRRDSHVDVGSKVGFRALFLRSITLHQCYIST